MSSMTAREEEREARWRTARKVGHRDPGVTYAHYVQEGSTLYEGVRHSFANRTVEEEYAEADRRAAEKFGDTKEVMFRNYVPRIRR